MKRKMLFALAGALALCAAATAGAVALTPAPKQAELSVSADGLDLSNHYDADLYLNRIEAAARRACGVDLEPHPVAQRRAWGRCVNDAMRVAVSQTTAPTVLRRFAERGETVFVAL